MARLCGKGTHLYEVHRKNKLHSEPGKARISKVSFLLNTFLVVIRKNSW